MAVVTEKSKFTRFEKACSNSVGVFNLFLKFSIDHPNFLVLT
jgi:hypothetical protein